MPNIAFMKRLQLEMKWLEECPFISAAPEADNVLMWNATIQGPPETPYEGGTFHLQIFLPENYPFYQPNIKFQTKIFHPNIHEKNICVDILKSQWSPVLNISKVLISIVSLLSDPNPDSPLNQEAARLYKSDMVKYNETVRQCVKEFAVDK